LVTAACGTFIGPRKASMTTKRDVGNQPTSQSGRAHDPFSFQQHWKRTFLGGWGWGGNIISTTVASMIFRWHCSDGWGREGKIPWK
jgi:hypothetical protein